MRRARTSVRSVICARRRGSRRRSSSTRTRRSSSTRDAAALPVRLGGGGWRRAHLGRDVVGRALLVRVVRALLVLNVAREHHVAATHTRRAGGSVVCGVRGVRRGEQRVARAARAAHARLSSRLTLHVHAASSVERVKRAEAITRAQPCGIRMPSASHDERASARDHVVHLHAHATSAESMSLIRLTLQCSTRQAQPPAGHERCACVCARAVVRARAEPCIRESEQQQARPSR